MKVYFRQAIQILRQNMLMSTIAILGTALAITMIMTIVVSEEIQNASVAPEINRDRTYYLTREAVRDTAGSSWSSNIQYETYRDNLREMQTPEYVSALGGGNFKLGIPGKEEKINGFANLTDANYWRILAFNFKEGRSYTEEEFTSGVKYVVLSDKTHRELGKGESLMGKEIMLNENPYHVIGIVEDVPKVFKNAAADIWIPYTSTGRENFGLTTVLLLARQNSDYLAIYDEVREIEKKYSITNGSRTIDLPGPTNHKIFASKFYGSSSDDLEEHINVQRRKKLFIFTILLLVPAINLSGFSLSRIKKRMSEIGVRKAFGAKKYVILIQVLYENLITSLIGGIIGLIASYIVVFYMRDWLLGIPPDNAIPIGTLVSPWIFVAVFVICILINLLSSGIPAWRASRMNITNSLNQNDRQS